APRVGRVADSSQVETSLLYIAGFTLRAGWRFDVGPFFLLPEIGAGYALERFTMNGDAHVGRVFGGGRAGWSGPLGPGLRIEPAIYGHAGFGWYDSHLNGPAFDAGVALDLRIRTHF